MCPVKLWTLIGEFILCRMSAELVVVTPKRGKAYDRIPSRNTSDCSQSVSHTKPCVRFVWREVCTYAR